MEKVTKKNKSQKNGDSTKGNVNVYIYNIVKQNPRKKSSSKNQKKEVSKAFNVINYIKSL